MLTHPLNEAFDFPSVGLYCHYHFNHLRRGGDDFTPIELEKMISQMRGRAFVPADPRVILNQTEAECRGLCRQVSLVIRGGLLWAR